MKKNTTSTYRTHSLERIEAPAGKDKKAPKASKTSGGSDLRTGGKR